MQFAAYKQFCDDTAVEKKRSIDEAAEQIDMLKADIAKAVADAAQCGATTNIGRRPAFREPSQVAP